MFTLTVSQLNRYVKAVLEEDGKLSDLYIKGEISNFTRHYRSGHFYFSLRDDKSSIKAVMFASYSSQVPFEPQNGMMLLVRASLGVFERDGVYQLYVTDMQPDGAGSIALAFEQLKMKLSTEGLFDDRHKKPLPAFPLKIGVVTSETGAAFQDIVNVLSRRYPLAKLILSPSRVQGAGAEDELIHALKALDTRCDVIIIGRGGGSAEDLWCFNSEKLARAIFMAKTPIISAVGHETDYTICDFVADVRAPTPSAAAEIAAPSVDELHKQLLSTGEFLKRSAFSHIERADEALDMLSARPALTDPMVFVEKKQKKLDSFTEKLYNNRNAVFGGFEKTLAAKAALLDSLSPLRVLSRGYAVVYADDKLARSITDLEKSTQITIKMHNGTLKVQTMRSAAP